MFHLSREFRYVFVLSCCVIVSLVLYLISYGTQCVLDTKACIVTGGCCHSYHRRCILDWVKVDHDDCPNCRAGVWDPIEYERISNEEGVPSPS